MLPHNVLLLFVTNHIQFRPFCQPKNEIIIRLTLFSSFKLCYSNDVNISSFIPQPLQNGMAQQSKVIEWCGKLAKEFAQSCNMHPMYFLEANRANEQTKMNIKNQMVKDRMNGMY